MTPFLNKGYATMSMTTRGFGQSCGTATSRTELGAACNNGYVRLMDTRYEVRDAQELAGQLADEGRTSFTQIGAIGGSYGGGMSMALGALKNRKMLPDGSLTAWQSPNGTPMQIAAATPEIPWTDLPYSLVPNGGTLDYVYDAPYQGRTGVLKSSWENASLQLRPVVLLRGGGSRSRRGPAQLAHRLQRGRAIRRRRRCPEPDVRGHPGRAHDASLVVLHRSLAATGSDADLKRLDR